MVHGQNVNDGVLLQLLERRVGARPGPEQVERPGRRGAPERRCPETLRPGFQVANNGVLKLDSRRQAIQDQYPLRIAKATAGSVTATVVGLRSERRPDVRRATSGEQARARSHLPALQEVEAAVAGQDQGRQERRHHEPAIK